MVEITSDKYSTMRWIWHLQRTYLTQKVRFYKESTKRFCNIWHVGRTNISHRKLDLISREPKIDGFDMYKEPNIMDN